MVNEMLDGLRGQKTLTVKDLMPGVYLYRITEDGTVTLQGKFVKQ